MTYNGILSRLLYQGTERNFFLDFFVLVVTYVIIRYKQLLKTMMESEFRVI